MSRRGLSAAAGVVAAVVVPVAVADADDGWVAAASSPSHEQAELVWGVDRGDAEGRALAQCAVLERADDCLLLASGPECIAIAWDADQPINRAHGASGGGREVVIRAAMAAAGPYANDVSSRCSWDYGDPGAGGSAIAQCCSLFQVPDSGVIAKTAIVPSRPLVM